MSARENGALLELVSCRQEDKISGNPNNDCELWIGTTKLAGLVTTSRLACSDDISRIFRICAPARRGDARGVGGDLHGGSRVSETTPHSRLTNGSEHRARNVEHAASDSGSRMGASKISKSEQEF